MSGDSGSLLPAFVRKSYATRLGVALTLAILAMVAFGLVVSTQASTTLKDDEQGDLTALSSSQAGQLDEWIDNTQRSIRGTSADATLASGNVTRANEYLRSLAARDALPRDTVAAHYLNTTSD